MLCLERKKQEVSKTEIKRDTAADSTEIKLLLLDSSFNLQQPLNLPFSQRFKQQHERRALAPVLCPSKKLFGLTKVSSKEKKPPERKGFLQLLLSQFLCTFSNLVFAYIIAFHDTKSYKITSPNTFIFRHWTGKHLRAYGHYQNTCSWKRS